MSSQRGSQKFQACETDNLWHQASLNGVVLGESTHLDIELPARMQWTMVSRGCGTPLKPPDGEGPEGRSLSSVGPPPSP
jgi:hypothetical protein